LFIVIYLLFIIIYAFVCAAMKISRNT